jgi:hypothetical protein
VVCAERPSNQTVIETVWLSALCALCAVTSPIAWVETALYPAEHPVRLTVDSGHSRDWRPDCVAAIGRISIIRKGVATGSQVAPGLLSNSVTILYKETVIRLCLLSDNAQLVASLALECS